MKNNNLLFWRVILSIMFSLAVNIILGAELKYIPLIGTFSFFASYFVFKEKQIEQVAEFILTDGFGVWLDFIFKCLVINFSASMFFTMVVLTGYYKNKPEIDITTIFYGFFSFFWLITFLVKKYTRIKIPICDSDKNNSTKE